MYIENTCIYRKYVYNCVYIYICVYIYLYMYIIVFAWGTTGNNGVSLENWRVAETLQLFNPPSMIPWCDSSKSVLWQSRTWEKTGREEENLTVDVGIQHVHIWRFPKSWGYSVPNHPKLDHFSIETY